MIFSHFQLKKFWCGSKALRPVMEEWERNKVGKEHPSSLPISYGSGAISPFERIILLSERWHGNWARCPPQRALPAAEVKKKVLMGRKSQPPEKLAHPKWRHLTPNNPRNQEDGRWDELCKYTLPQSPVPQTPEVLFRASYAQWMVAGLALFSPDAFQESMTQTTPLILDLKFWHQRVYMPQGSGTPCSLDIGLSKILPSPPQWLLLWFLSGFFVVFRGGRGFVISTAEWFVLINSVLTFIPLSFLLKICLQWLSAGKYRVEDKEFTAKITRHFSLRLDRWKKEKVKLKMHTLLTQFWNYTAIWPPDSWDWDILTNWDIGKNEHETLLLTKKTRKLTNTMSHF